MPHFESLEARALLAGSVTGLTLLNASTDKAIGPLREFESVRPDLIGKPAPLKTSIASSHSAHRAGA